MNEDKTYEPQKIEIEVGRYVDALSIADGIIHYLKDVRSEDRFIMSFEEEADAYEDIRMIGEALLSVYKAYQRAIEVREKYRR